MEDVSVCGLVHDDVTAFNLLCFTGSETEIPQAHCLCHNIIHGWRIINFDCSFKVDMENAGILSKQALCKNISDLLGHFGVIS